MTEEERYDIVKLKEEINDLLLDTNNGTLMDLHKQLTGESVGEEVEFYLSKIDDYSYLKNVARMITLGTRWYGKDK